LEGEMAGRWTGFDRPLVADAFRAADPGAVLAVDLRADRAFWAESLRLQSAEAGQAFLAAAARLGDPAATALRTAALEGRAAGHLPVAQGAVFRSLGLSETLALAASAHAARQSSAGAAVRLGLAGAIETQRTIARLGPGLSAGLEPPADTTPAPFAPLSEIAALRPPETRLFAN
ncbi:MAG: urease accessory UreF family protein, partial [Paracoccaceae bacterium]